MSHHVTSHLEIIIDTRGVCRRRQRPRGGSPTLLLATAPLAVALGLALALLGLPCPAAAQATGSHVEAAGAPESFVHESWTVQDGLPVNSVTALLQSRDGYLWIATFDGLVRFDGVRFTVFTPSNSPGLPSSRVLTLLEARDGTLWLGTERRQLVRFRHGEFTHFGPERGLAGEVWTLYEDPSGTLWVGTDTGLGYIRGERFVPVAAETLRRQVTSMVRRRDGTLWVGTRPTGLVRIEAGRGTPLLDARDLAPAHKVASLYEDPEGTLWIGTDAGAWRYADAPERLAVGGEVTRFQRSPLTGELWVLSRSQVLRVRARAPVRVLERQALVYDWPTALLPDVEGRMLYTSGAELHREGQRIFTLPPDRAGLRTGLQTITAMAWDHEGSLWLGTFGAGLHRLKPAPFRIYSEPEGLSKRNVLSVYEDRSGTIWIGSVGGATNRLVGGRITRFPDEAGYQGTVHSFLQDRDERLWVGGRGRDGLTLCPRPGLRCDQVAGLPIHEGAILALHEDAAGAIWIGTDEGLLRTEGGAWHRFTAAEGAPGFPVRVFQPTRDGALWMGSNGGGLARYQHGRFRHVTVADGLPFDLIRSLHEDQDGWLWVGTEGRGLVRLDPRDWTEGRSGGRIVRYGMADGLYDEVIHQILEDDFDRLWMSGNRGIFWVRRAELNAFAEGRIRRIHSTGYTERDGLRNREANGGSQPAGIRSRDGRLWFPTQDGVAVVDPARQRNPLAPNVLIEQITAGGVALHPGNGVLALGVEQRDLQIAYTALSFLAPANVRFRYRLEPYDREWVEAGNRRTAYYTRVPPGRYTFRVLASNNDGVWNEQGAALELQLQPHFYETGLFRLLLVAGVGLLIVAGFGLRVRRLRARTSELARLVDERTAELRQREAQLRAQTEQLQGLDRAKSRFFANVSHEFRTPLTLILGPLQDLAEWRGTVAPDVLQRQVEMMTRNAHRLHRLVNQVLDLARLESGSLTLHPAPRDLVELARTSTLSFTPLAEQREIALSFRAEAEPLIVNLDADQMEKVVLNLLSNALKFTAPGGEVEVTSRKEGGSAVLMVRDTGAGIAPEQLPKVFERFYQADSSATRRHEGTGIGLSLVRELVELHDGTVAAESQPGVGSTFVVRLPLGPSLPAGPPLPGAEEQGSRSAEGPKAPPSGLSFAPPPLRSPAGGVATEEDRTTVLVVDDHADIRAYVRSVLESAYRVLEAPDGQAGLELAREALPDLVIADLMMPRLDGFDLARALRADPATDCIPVILLTARAGEAAEIDGLGAGADDYLSKPFHPGVLEARVGSLIASRRRLRERFAREGFPAAGVSTDPVPERSELEERLRGIIEANLTDAGFNPEALAAAAGLSYKRLYTRLREELETTPSQFIRTVRVECAADLLRQGAGSITEIAYSVGFNSLSYFYRSFHQRFGRTPAELPPTRA